MTDSMNLTHQEAQARWQSIIPRPVQAQIREGVFPFSPATVIRYDPRQPELRQAGELLAAWLRTGSGLPLPVEVGTEAGPGVVLLALRPGDMELGEEGYVLAITPESIVLTANQPAGILFGLQTLRQLLPPALESGKRFSGLCAAQAGTIRDYPRFSWRGFMLDTARHFFPPEEVKRLIDLAALYKLNRFHLHLTDDQGWRIMINAWPNLARIGGGSAVNGAPGGYYTQADYTDLAQYARERGVILVPEIDMPGHTNAALASYGELNHGGQPAAIYTGTAVGFSSLAVEEELTYRFVSDVIGEIAAITPGPFIHIGGDESDATDPQGYRRFIERVQEIVHQQGKRMVGWEEISTTTLYADSIAQAWKSPLALEAARQGAKVIMSPANKVYLDMKATADSRLGQEWAGIVNVAESYDWDPAGMIPGLDGNVVIGAEAPLWTETVLNLADAEQMIFPRLIGLADITWSPLAGRDWEEYRTRLAAHNARLKALRVNFYPSAQVNWR